jgi:hypothetical protein
MNPNVLFRSDRYSEEEKKICEKYFPVTTSRMKIPENSLVIGRYSVLPFYHELASDLQEVGSRLINSPLEHSFISRFDWYHQIAGLTPRTWFDTTEAFLAFDSLPHGMILKGRTNSAKSWEWMYAKTKEDFWRIDKFLHQHEMIANKGTVRTVALIIGKINLQNIVICWWQIDG